MNFIICLNFVLGQVIGGTHLEATTMSCKGLQGYSLVIPVALLGVSVIGVRLSAITERRKSFGTTMDK
jgi:hypothetical protein